MATLEVITGDMLGADAIKTLDRNVKAVNTQGNIQIVNNLTETTQGKALDATQGKVLKGQVDEIKSFVNKKTGIVTGTNKNTYVTIAKIDPSLATSMSSTIQLFLGGTTNGIVVHAKFEILVNHNSSILVKSESGNYTQIMLRVISDTNGRFYIQVKLSSYSTELLSMFVMIHAYNGETITILSDNPALPSNYTLIHDHTTIAIGTNLTSVAPSFYPSINVNGKPLAKKEQEPWITATLKNGWTNLQTVQYYKDEFEVVHVRGRIQNGTTSINTVLLSLPSGYRPNVYQYINGSTYSTITDIIPCLLQVDMGGDITIVLTAKQYIVLDFSFRTT
jgi:hypothetical protein